MILQFILSAIVGAAGMACWAWPKIQRTQTEDQRIAKLNQELKLTQQHLLEQNNDLKQQYDAKIEELSNLSKQVAVYVTDYYSQTVKTEQLKANEAISKLRDRYQEAKESGQKEYLTMLADCEKDFNLQLDKKRLALTKIERQLDELDKLYTASIEARIREKQIAEQKSFYCLTIDPIDQADIITLEKIKSRLSKPRILSMLIWSTYYQKPMTALCNNVLGLNPVTGIYKLTNQTTQECYIGQAKDVAARWKEHAKCGLDIDRPQGNKLYKAMIDYGLESFSWELLEKCAPAQLNEREKYYIALYKSADYGYNTLKGAGK